MIPLLHLYQTMTTPNLDGVEEYGFQLGKFGNLSQTPLNSLLILEFHLNLNHPPAFNLHDGYFSWFERLSHLLGTSLDLLAPTKASGLMFLIPASISCQHTDQLPLLLPHQLVLLTKLSRHIQTSALSYLTTSSGCQLGRSLELTEIRLQS